MEECEKLVRVRWVELEADFAFLSSLLYSEDEAKALVKAGVKYVAEGSNMVSFESQTLQSSRSSTKLEAHLSRSLLRFLPFSRDPPRRPSTSSRLPELPLRP